MTDYHDLLESIDAAMTESSGLLAQSTDPDERRMLQLSRDRLFEAFQWADAAYEEVQGPMERSA